MHISLTSARGQWALVGVAVGVLLTACVKSDLNTPCTLMRGEALPDGGVKAVAIPLSDVQSAAAVGRDFLMLGTGQCEDHFCVRDSHFQQPDTDLTVAALGYCSRHCQVGETCPSADAYLDKTSDRLTCQALFLDTETASNLGIQGITDPYFCVRSADAGVN